MKIHAYMMLLFFSLALSAHAETVVLKNGRRVTGQLVESHDSYILIRRDRLRVVYFRGLIDKIISNDGIISPTLNSVSVMQKKAKVDTQCPAVRVVKAQSVVEKESGAVGEEIIEEEKNKSGESSLINQINDLVKISKDLEEQAMWIFTEAGSVRKDMEILFK